MLYTIICIVPLLIISLAMLVRANDLGRRPGIVWHFRRIGLILAGVMPWAMVFGVVWTPEDVSIVQCLFWWGVALVFMTSPFLPPFWKYLLYGDPVHDLDDQRGLPRGPS